MTTKRSVIIESESLAAPDEDGGDVILCQRVTVPGAEVVLHPEDDESVESSLGQTLGDLVADFEEEFEVCIDQGGGVEGAADVFSFDLADHPYATNTELEECQFNLVARVEEWVRNSH